MSDFIDYWADEPLHERAVRKLVEAHRQEYDELTGAFNAEREEELERRIMELQRELLHLKGQNPNGTNVGALEQTANGLAKENDRLVADIAALTRKLETKTKQLDSIKRAVKT